MWFPEFEETTGWSSSDLDGSNIEHSESEETTLIMTPFQTPTKAEYNPSSEAIDEEPFDMDLNDTYIMQRIVSRSYGLDKQLKVVG